MRLWHARTRGVIPDYEPRCAVALVLDTAAVAPGAATRSLQAELRELLDHLRANPVAAQRLDLGIIIAVEPPRLLDPRDPRRALASNELERAFARVEEVQVPTLGPGL